MYNVCELTGKHCSFGHKVSHSNVKTSRQFRVNIINKVFYSEVFSEGKKLRIAKSTYDTIQKYTNLDLYLLSLRPCNLISSAKILRKQVIKFLKHKFKEYSPINTLEQLISERIKSKSGRIININHINNNSLLQKGTQ